MAGSTLSTFDAILKTQYLGPIREQLNSSSVLYSRLEKNEDSVVGKNFTIPLHYGRNEGVGARAEGGTLPDALWFGKKFAGLSSKLIVITPDVRVAAS